LELCRFFLRNASALKSVSFDDTIKGLLFEPKPVIPWKNVPSCLSSLRTFEATGCFANSELLENISGICRNLESISISRILTKNVRIDCVVPYSNGEGVEMAMEHLINQSNKIHSITFGGI